MGSEWVASGEKRETNHTCKKIPRVKMNLNSHEADDNFIFVFIFSSPPLFHAVPASAQVLNFVGSLLFVIPVYFMAGLRGGAGSCDV